MAIHDPRIEYHIQNADDRRKQIGEHQLLGPLERICGEVIPAREEIAADKEEQGHVKCENGSLVKHVNFRMPQQDEKDAYGFGNIKIRRCSRFYANCILNIEVTEIEKNVQTALARRQKDGFPPSANLVRIGLQKYDQQSIADKRMESHRARVYT